MPGVLASPRARPVAVGLAVVAGLAVAGCGKVPSPVGAAVPPASPSARSSPGGASAAGAVAPLTGLPVSSADAARPAVALDVAGPNPRGLAAADVVFVEITSPVRYIAVYQSRDASGVGPITTTQPTDRAALSALRPIVGYDSAAAPRFIKLLDNSKIIDAGYAGHTSLYSSGAGGPTTSTRAISRVSPTAAAPQPLFSYRGAGTGDTLATREFRCTSVSVAIPGAGTEEWVFNQRADRWDLTRNGPRVAVANLVVQMVGYKQINAQGVAVPTAEITGDGRAEVFSGAVAGGSGGTGAAGTWSKPHVNDITNYFDSTGTPMAFQPGPTWVIFAPTATHVSTAGAQG
jgi:hypothetical protein